MSAPGDTLVLRWRRLPPPIVTRWRGPGRATAAARFDAPRPIAAIIGPPGEAGPPGPEGPPADLAGTVIDGGEFF